MKKLVFLIAVFFLISNSYAQNPNQHIIDSLLIVTGKTKDKQRLFELNSVLGKLYFKGYDYEKSIAVNKKNLVLAKALKSKKTVPIRTKT